jgi:hypothetical protein
LKAKTALRMGSQLTENRRGQKAAMASLKTISKLVELKTPMASIKFRLLDRN